MEFRDEELELRRPQVTFAYVRQDGRRFALIAHRYSPASGPVPRYIYDADAAPHFKRGVLQLVKHQSFIWRNDNQVTRAVASEDISAAEIQRIRAAMHGTPLPQYDGRTDRERAPRLQKIYLLPKE
ncbi:MAG: hypothetical protein ABR508_03260 [Candidatus Baltobacteraceae bacterium]